MAMKMTLTLCVIAALLLQLPTHTRADFLPFSIDVKHLRTYFWATSTVAENWLYIAGGEIYHLNDTTNSFEQSLNNKTIAIDLSHSWSTDSVNATLNPTDDHNVEIRRPTLWYNSLKDKVNIYGGWPYPTSESLSPVHVSAFTPGAGDVTLTTEFKKGDGSSFSKMTRKMGGLFTSSPTAYYNIGGHGTDTTDPDFGPFNGFYSAYYTLAGMLVFDFASETWTNETLDFQRVHGDAQYIPIFGDEGVLVLLGGDEPTAQNPLTDGSSLVPMDTIRVYDIANKKWYSQTATGKIPAARYNLCSVSAGGSSNNSYEIYIFGGTQTGTISQDLQTEMGTVYILSLPSFTWVTTSVSSWYRSAHYCQIIGSRQMLSIGGAGTDWYAVDNFANGLGIFDMVDLKWKADYDQTAKAYERPGIIESLYDNGKPNATVTWSDPALQTIFKANTSPSSTSSANPSTSSAAAGGSSTKKSIAGPVAGGVIGGVAVIIAIAFGLWCLRRRRRTHAYKAPDHLVEIDGSRVNEMYQPAAVHEMQSGPGENYQKQEQHRPQRKPVPPVEMA